MNPFHSRRRQVATTNLTSHHVLFLIDRMHSTEGGAEGAIQKLCRFLPQHGFRCSVATFWAGDGVNESFPGTLHLLPLTKIYNWTAMKHAVAFSRLLRSQQVEIVHTIFPSSDLWGGLVARLSGCPILVSSRRDMGILRGPKHRLACAFANHFFDQVQAVSDTVREFCISNDHVPPEKVVTVYNGVDLEQIDSAAPTDLRVSLGWAADSPLVATVANIRNVKGVDIFVQAAALVRDEVPEARFVVIGAALQEPDYERQLRSAVTQLGLDQHFIFLGMRKDVISLLKRCDVFCLPSRSEGMSNALLEAMACGLPCAATNVGGNAEVVREGESGFLVRADAPDALAVRIVQLLTDRPRAERMGKNGRRIVETRFTVQRMVERLAHFYGNLLQDHGLALPKTPEFLNPSAQEY